MKYSIFLEFKNRGAFKGFLKRFKSDKNLKKFVSDRSSGKIVELVFDNKEKTEAVGDGLKASIGKFLKSITYQKGEKNHE